MSTESSTERKLRVAVLTDYFPTSVQPWAGHSAFQTLLRLANQCEVETFYPESVYPQFLTPKTRTYAALDRSYEVPGIRTHYLPYTAIPLASRPLNGWAAASATYEAIHAFKPDVILSYIVYPDGFAAVRVAKRLGIPAVVTAIGSDLNRISGYLVRVLTRYTLRKAAATVTVSRDLLGTAERLGAPPQRSLAILNGCDTSKFYPRDRTVTREALNIPLDQEIVLYVGRLDIRKGLIELIEAFAQLRQRRSGTHCYIVGEGSDRDALNDVVRRCNLSAHVTFVPSCNTDRVALWIGACNLLTLPSYKEGCPNVILEALCSGRPVVASNVGGIPELMDDESGALIEPHTVEPLSQALESVLERKWDADALSSKHHRSWQHVSDELASVLERVVRNRLQQ